jgi:hypothetical protein
VPGLWLYGTHGSGDVGLCLFAVDMYRCEVKAIARSESARTLGLARRVCNRSLHSHYDYALQELVALYIVWETHFQVVIWRFLDYVDMVHLSEVVFTVSSWIERINTREIWM